MNSRERARRHAALGDEKRLLIVDSLSLGDRTVAELSDILKIEGNLLAHHLGLLEGAGLIERRVSEGDRRRRYVTLRSEDPRLLRVPLLALGAKVAFICTQNSARSQFAAAMWEQMTGEPAASAGTQPSARVHPKAVKIASEFELDISGATPSTYSELPADLDVLVSVCDRAAEAGQPEAASNLHWSIPDPVRIGTLNAFRSAFGEISERMGRLTEGVV